MAQSTSTIILAVIVVLTTIFRTLLYIGTFSGRFDVVLVAILAIIFIALATYRLFITTVFRSTLFLAATTDDIVDRTHIKILTLLLVGAFLRTLLSLGRFTGRLEVILKEIVGGIFFAVIYFVVFLFHNAPVPQPTDDDNNEEDGGDEEGPVARNDHDIESTPTAADHEVVLMAIIFLLRNAPVPQPTDEDNNEDVGDEEGPVARNNHDIESTPTAADREVDIDNQDIEMPARDDDRVQSTTSDHEPPARDDTSMQSTTSDHAEAVECRVEDHDPPTRDDHVDMPSTASEHEVDDDQDHHDPPTQDDQVDMPSTESDRGVDVDQDHDDPPTRDDHDMQSTGTASDHEVGDDQDVELASSAESLPETIRPELRSLPSTFLPR